ncbi:MAG: hypothetical protein STSR0008_17110 [Ignavibacterium sp.]
MSNKGFNFLKAILSGSIAAITLILLFNFTLSSFNSFFIDNKNLNQTIESLFVAPIIEEFIKGIFLLYFLRNKYLYRLIDGLIYGGAIGIGFSIIENILYFIFWGETLSQLISIILLRTFSTTLMHCISTAILGAFLSLAKFYKLNKKIIYFFFGFFLAMLIHFFWNLNVLYIESSFFKFLFLILLILIFIVTFWIFIRIENNIIFNELLDEANNGFIPFEYIPILSSYRKNKKGWIEEKIRKQYIDIVIALSFKKKISKRTFINSDKMNNTYKKYKEEIDYYRNYLQNLLSNL